MKLVWSQKANDDRRAAIEYIAQFNIAAALAVLDELERQTDQLPSFPEMGRPGRVTGTRELVVNRCPFILVYHLNPEDSRVEILRMLHGAQAWPPINEG